MSKAVQIGLIILACLGAALFALRDVDWTAGQLEPLFEAKGGFAMPMNVLGVFKAAGVIPPLLNAAAQNIDVKEIKPIQVDPGSADEDFIEAFDRYINKEDTQALKEMADKAPHTSDPAVMFSVLGWAYLSDGNWQEVVNSFQNAAALKPNDLAIKLNLARALIQTREYDDGKRLIEEVLAKDPENLIAQNTKRWLDRKLERLKKKKAKTG